jgi:hypothetical protein
MNCLDCASKDRATPAVGVCHDCGAGVCVDHAVTRDQYLTRIVTIALEVAVEPPARVLRCEVCSAAVDAVSRANHPRPSRRTAGVKH